MKRVTTTKAIVEPRKNFTIIGDCMVRGFCKSLGAVLFFAGDDVGAGSDSGASILLPACDACILWLCVEFVRLCEKTDELAALASDPDIGVAFLLMPSCIGMAEASPLWLSCGAVEVFFVLNLERSLDKLVLAEEDGALPSPSLDVRGRASIVPAARMLCLGDAECVRLCDQQRKTMRAYGGPKYSFFLVQGKSVRA
jgi:hypothetical protein